MGTSRGDGPPGSPQRFHLRRPVPKRPAQWSRGHEVSGQLQVRGRIHAGMVPWTRDLLHHRGHEVRRWDLNIYIFCQRVTDFFSCLVIAGEFRGGRIWGNGLMTYNDGKVGSEGYFQDSRFSRDGCAKNDIKKARKVAAFSRR